MIYKVVLKGGIDYSMQEIVVSTYMARGNDSGGT